MNVVDSSGWLEYFAEGANADFFALAIEAKRDLIVPVISIYEVFKRVRQQTGEDDALQAAAQLLQGQVIELDVALALQAAKTSVELKLPMADSIILTTARVYKAVCGPRMSTLKVLKASVILGSRMCRKRQIGRLTTRSADLLRLARKRLSASVRPPTASFDQGKQELADGD